MGMDEVYTQERKEVSGNSAASYPITTGDWFITMLITAIPIVGIVMLFVWAFGGSTNPTKANWAKASLLWMLIGGIIFVLFMVVFFAAFYSRYASEM